MTLSFFPVSSLLLLGFYPDMRGSEEKGVSGRQNF
jgi:hypothetical protein